MTACYSNNFTKKKTITYNLYQYIYIKKQAIWILSIVSHQIFVLQTPSNTSTASSPGASSSPYSENDRYVICQWGNFDDI